MAPKTNQKQHRGKMSCLELKELQAFRRNCQGLEILVAEEQECLVSTQRLALEMNY